MGNPVQFPAEVTVPASSDEELDGDQTCETDPLCTTGRQEEAASRLSGQAEPLPQCPALPQVRHLLPLSSSPVWSSLLSKENVL